MLSQKTKKFLKWLIPFAFSIAGYLNIAKTNSFTSELGANASGFLTAHGIYQPVFGAILVTAGFTIIVYHIEKSKQPIEFIPPAEKKYIRKLQALEKKYGADWLDKIDSTLASLSNLGSKKK